MENDVANITVEKDEKKGLGLLPYQVAYLKDDSRFKIVEKSRRIGFTYVQSLEDVLDCGRENGGVDVWFASADNTAAAEYIRYCSKWAEVLNIVAEDLGEVILDSEKDVKALSIRFANGQRIHALSSNPSQFRSKGGKVVLDEFAFHKNQDALWKAAAATALRGDMVRVISTYNGKSNRYYRMIMDAKKGNKWSLHTVTIYDALEQGLLKSMGQNDTAKTRKEFLEDCKTLAGDVDTFEQEFNCNPSDSASSWIPYDLITPCESNNAGKPILYRNEHCYLGMDIGRKNDLSVIVVGEMLGDVLWVRELKRMKNTRYSEQLLHLELIHKTYKIVCGRYDETGLGNAFVENAGEKLGGHIVQGVTFTNSAKHHLAIVLKQAFEDQKIRIPNDDPLLRDAIHSVRKMITDSGNHPKFDAGRSEHGHADEFWALALMVDASLSGYQKYEFTRVSLNGDEDDMSDGGSINRFRF